jgi:hypothetical protein
MMRFSLISYLLFLLFIHSLNTLAIDPPQPTPLPSSSTFSSSSSSPSSPTKTSNIPSDLILVLNDENWSVVLEKQCSRGLFGYLFSRPYPGERWKAIRIETTNLFSSSSSSACITSPSSPSCASSPSSRLHELFMHTSRCMSNVLELDLSKARGLQQLPSLSSSTSSSSSSPPSPSLWSGLLISDSIRVLRLPEDFNLRHIPTTLRVWSKKEGKELILTSLEYLLETTPSLALHQHLLAKLNTVQNQISQRHRLGRWLPPIYASSSFFHN